MNARFSLNLSMMLLLAADDRGSGLLEGAERCADHERHPVQDECRFRIGGKQISVQTANGTVTLSGKWTTIRSAMRQRGTHPAKPGPSRL